MLAFEEVDYLKFKEPIPLSGEFAKALDSLSETLSQEEVALLFSKLKELHVTDSISSMTSSEIGGKVRSYDLIPIVRGDKLEGVLKVKYQRLSSLLVNTLESLEEIFLITDREGRIIYVNDNFSKVMGYDRVEVIGRKPSILSSGYHSKHFYSNLWRTITTGKTFRGIFIDRRKDGELILLDQLIKPLTDSRGDILGFLSLSRDLSPIISGGNANTLLFDPVTSLPRKEIFTREIKSLLELMKVPSALLVFRIELNCYLSRKDFERRLRLFSKILLDLIPVVGGGIAGKLSENEIAVFLEGKNTEADAFAVSLELVRTLNERVKDLQGLSYRVGLAIYPKDGSNPEDLLEKAITSMESGLRYRGEEHLNLYIYEEASVKSELELLLDLRNYVLAYQPYVRLSDGKVVGAEALLYLRREGNLVSPSRFIHVLEETGFILEVTGWIIDTVSRDLRSFLNLSDEIYMVSVNVSPLQLRISDGFDLLKGKLEALGGLSRYITLELTEGALVVPGIFDELIRLKERYKVKLSLDDFGKAYSSLYVLKDMPLDVVKIDISFIREMLINDRSYKIVKSIIDLAKDLGISVVAEGIADEDQFKELKALGCELGQGYLFGKPMLFDDFMRYLASIRKA